MGELLERIRELEAENAKLKAVVEVAREDRKLYKTTKTSRRGIRSTR